MIALSSTPVSKNYWTGSPVLYSAREGEIPGELKVFHSLLQINITFREIIGITKASAIEAAYNKPCK